MNLILCLLNRIFERERERERERALLEKMRYTKPKKKQKRKKCTLLALSKRKGEDTQWAVSIFFLYEVTYREVCWVDLY